MSLSLIKTPELTYQEACEFFDYKKNKLEFQNKIKQFEKAVTKHCLENNDQEFNSQITGEAEGAITHNFADGQYIRTAVAPKHSLVSTKIHAKNHPFFLMKGDISIFGEDGVKRIQAPFHAITEAGTKRILYVHEECIFITVHRTDCLNIDDIVNEVTVDDFSKLKLTGFDVEQIDKLMEQIT
tara:strand:- start:10 stop:558 length:549 start_codon:yes stop_codon:yes gene_type:complete